jgi:hypothetical protein
MGSKQVKDDLGCGCVLSEWFEMKFGLIDVSDDHTSLSGLVQL